MPDPPVVCLWQIFPPALLTLGSLSLSADSLKAADSRGSNWVALVHATSETKFCFFLVSLLHDSHVHWLQYPDLAPDSEGNTTHRSLLTQCPMTAPPCHYNALIKTEAAGRYCGDLCSLHENKRKYVSVLLLNIIALNTDAKDGHIK